MESASHIRPQSRDEFEIAIICALPIEWNAVETVFSVYYESDGFSYRKAEGDLNTYTTGRLGNQHVVLAYMPGMSIVPATAVASHLRLSFKNIKVAIIAGVCGGAPKNTAGEDILKGDVIISTQVIQTDFGRQYPHGFIRKKGVEDTLGRASPETCSFIGKMSEHLASKRLEAKTNTYTSEICSRREFLQYAYPGPQKDQLHKADFVHKHRKSGACSICDKCNTPRDKVCQKALTAFCTELGCDETKLVERERLRQVIGMGEPGNKILTAKMQAARKPCIHFGRVACSNQVMRSGQDRNTIVEEEGVIGFEMESAGAWDYVPTIVIKSVCDYADTHKDNHWQAYAATTAAACAKAVVEEWRSIDRPTQNLPDQVHSGYRQSPNPVY